MVPISQMKSPGVFIDEVDLSTYVSIMDTSKIFGIVTIAQNGPIGEVTLVESVADFEENFGYPIDAGGLACTKLLGVTSSLKVVRAAGASAAYRTVTLAGTGSESEAIANALVISYKYKGTLFADALKATVSRISGEQNDKFNLIIKKGDDEDAVELVNKNFTIVQASATDDYPYIIGDESTDFRFSFGSSATVASINEVADAAFSIGDNGLTLTDEQKRAAIDLFDDAENIDLDILAAPGFLDAASQLRLVTVAENRKDCFAVLDPPQGLTPEETANYVNGLNTTYPIQKLDTSYAGIYSPWGRTYNEYSGANEWVPPSVGVLHAMARMYQVQSNWVAPAGIANGFEISIFSELERTLTRPDRDTLYESHVNPLCNYKQQGLTSMGQKTLQRKKSSLDRINVRFAVNYVKRMADFSSVRYLFLAINDTTFNAWKSDISKQLTTMMLAGGLYDFRVKMDWETVTDEYLNNNMMPGIIQIKPVKMAEFIPIDVVIRNRSDEFE